MIRGGYGIFASSFIGNITASAIVGPPFWNYENPSYTAASLQRWETAFSNDPTVFLSPGVCRAYYDIDASEGARVELLRSERPAVQLRDHRLVRR